MRLTRRLVGLGVVLAVLGCQTGATEVAFKGRCVDPKGNGVKMFSLSVKLASAPASPAVTVSTQDSQYDARVRVVAPGASGGRLGPRTEQVTIEINALGYQRKRFTVTADQLFVGQVNTLNVTLEPNA